MGKPRLSDLSEEDQLKVRREVTRELNEAAQNARDAGRQLAAAAAAMEDSVARTCQAIVDKHMDQVNEHLAIAADALKEQIASEEARTRDHYARLLGAESYTGLLQYMIDHVYGEVVPEINRVLRTLPGGRTVQIGTRPKDEPSVIVMDERTWAARQAAGTLPHTDIVIDGR
jgi:hypothetical protein